MIQILKIFTTSIQFYLIGILTLGIVSGVSFTLISFTIPYQLSQSGYPTTIIGAIFLSALPYCFKPVVAPFIDRYSIPILCSKFGQRRGWALYAQTFLFLSSLGFLIIEPTDHIYVTISIAFIISCCAATQDIIIDAYRIERPITKKELALSTTFSGIGFRIGMLISSMGALYVSHIFNWYFVYLCSSIIILFGPIIILYIEEPARSEARHTSVNLISIKQYFETIYQSLLLLKQSQPNLLLVMLFIILYKASDSIPMAMSSPLFLDLSFTSLEIASISKAYGLLIMILGGFLGGIIVSKLGIFKGILICGILQLLSPLMFMFLSMSGHNLPIFIITITLQNFCCGLGGTAIVIYYSNLCNSEFVATQFSLISSFSSLVRIILSFLAGICANYVEWPQFFFANTLLSMLFILVFFKINNTKKGLTEKENGYIY